MLKRIRAERSAGGRKRGRGRGSALLNWLGRVVPLAALTLVIVVGGLGLRINDPSVLRQLRNMVFDEYQRFHPLKYDPGSPVRIVTIDEGSLERLGQWPWPRVRLAEIVRKLTEMGAAAVAIDVILAEPDRMSPENIAKLLPDGPNREALAASLEGQPRNDMMLAQALIASPSVIGVPR